MAILTEFIVHLHDDGQVTCSAVSAHSGAAAPGPGISPPDDDPWAGTNATSQPPINQQQGGQWFQQQPPATQQATHPSQTPSCQHGALKVVPGGFSQAKQKAYGPFWACPAGRGQQCRLDQKTLPPIPA